ncbi:tRNA epoxyqueuosine(34) reductase QueG [soil metagenome]
MSAARAAGSSVRPLPDIRELHRIAAAGGIDRLGVATAAILGRTRDDLFARRDAGLHADMAFTYRNPERSTDPTRTLPGVRSVIVGARSYVPTTDPERPEGIMASVARYSWTDHYADLREGLVLVADALRQAGERAVVLADDNAIVDREVAHQAGLGWYGKNANILIHGVGSFFVLGCVLTTAHYEPSVPTPAGFAKGCGSCRRCIDACPTGAIVSDGVIDANRCLAWVLQRPGPVPVELRAAVGERIYGCDDCQTSCPPTMRLGRRHHHDVPDPEAWVDVLELLASSDDELLTRHGRWYIAGRDPRWLRRNALIVLGNTATHGDQRVAAVLGRYRRDCDPVLAETAQWAQDQLASHQRPQPSPTLP